MRQKSVTRWAIRLGLIALIAVLIIVANRAQPQGERTIRVAAAKGQLVNASHFVPDTRTQRLLAVAAIDPVAAALFDGKRVDFLYAHELGVAESAEWRDAGCLAGSCTYLTYYNYDDGGTIELVINDENAVVATRTNPTARPGPSASILADVLDIANADPRVTDVLGDIRRARDVMVPMSTWLQDDACSQDWCVDLTFHDPTGSGRIFHVVVNMDEGEVARTFYTRGREPRAFSEPSDLDPNAPPWNDGCHEQDGWSVCWEMTAHDGLNLYDAAYAGQPIFSSAKISQVEAFYPSWPGGYRDEIGNESTVPPKFGTRLIEFDGGFEVRQLFTEPFDWPNCICCYRYEQIVTFYEDGTWEPRFISHGPGCDAWAEYRPFWRIDLDLGGAEDDTVWVWQDMQWVSAETETDLDLFGPLSLDGEKLATIDGEVNYRWAPVPTDPLGDDDARFFVVRYNDDEGNGPIAPGPADTYAPPSALVDGERVDGSNIVVWYVPILKTKKVDPYWCMPDPEPDLSPCESILTVSPGEALRQPTEDEIAALLALTPTPPPPGTAATPTAVAEIPPTPRPISGETAEEIILNSGCGACHLIGEYGEAGKVGPDLSNIGEVAAHRVPGQPAEEYLRNSILYPNLFIAPECPNGPCLANAMPGNYYQQLTDAQVDTMVGYLAGLTEAEMSVVGEATPTASNGVANEGGTVSAESTSPSDLSSTGVSPALTGIALAGVGAVLLAGAVLVWLRRRSAE